MDFIALKILYTLRISYYSKLKVLLHLYLQWLSVDLNSLLTYPLYYTYLTCLYFYLLTSFILYVEDFLKFKLVLNIFHPPIFPGLEVIHLISHFLVYIIDIGPCTIKKKLICLPVKIKTLALFNSHHPFTCYICSTFYFNPILP